MDFFAYFNLQHRGYKENESKLGRPTARNTARQGSVVNDTFAHNTRSELVEATVNNTEYQYDYDNIGNRLSSTEGDKTTTYMSNNLNQYTSIQEASEAAFTPQFDADGNQILIKTETGIWSATYNAENRPVTFTNSESNMVVECAYDSMGRRAYKKVTVNGEVTLHQRYIYRGYLQIACIDLTRTAHPALWYITWDPTQPVATRPLAIQINGTWHTYGWDLTKNICELYSTSGTISTTYTYTPFGRVTASGSATQPIQWSSEVWDAELGLVYYNWRYYNAWSGRWNSFEPLLSPNKYNYVNNSVYRVVDALGLTSYINYTEKDCVITVHLRLGIIDIRKEKIPSIQTMINNIVEEGNDVWNPKNQPYLGCCKIKIDITGKESHSVEYNYFPVFLVNRKIDLPKVKSLFYIPKELGGYDDVKTDSGSFVYTPIRFKDPYLKRTGGVLMKYTDGHNRIVYPDERVIPYFGVFTQDAWLSVQNGDVKLYVRSKYQYSTDFTYAHEIGHIMGLPDEYTGVWDIVDYIGDLMADSSVYSSYPINRETVQRPSVRADYYRRILSNLGKTYCWCDNQPSSGFYMG